MHAGRLGWSEQRVKGLAAELVEGLSGMGRPADAAAVASGYLHDAEAAAALFCQAHEWREVSCSISRAVTVKTQGYLLAKRASEGSAYRVHTPVEVVLDS